MGPLAPYGRTGYGLAEVPAPCLLPAMKLAVFADIHSNLEAFTACLEHARAHGAEQFAFVGDLVGYGADPSKVVELVIPLVEKGGVVVRGNHDAAAVRSGVDTMNQTAEQAILWTRKQLTERQQQFLSSLPLTVTRWDSFFVHASAQAPGDWLYVSDANKAYNSFMAARTGYIFCGHLHQSLLYYMGLAKTPVPFNPVAGSAIPVPRRRQWLAVIGAVGQPRDGNTAATYVMMDYSAVTLTYYRIPYDWPKAAEKIRAAGLPESLAKRLGKGE